MKNKIIKLVILVLFICFSSFFKLSFAIGSARMMFSGINLTLPVIGSLVGFPMSAMLIYLFFIFKKFFLGGVLTLGLPSLVATMALAMGLNRKKELAFFSFLDFCLRVFLPLLCMLLFIIHPIGNVAYLYSFYWLIPVALYFVQKLNDYKSIFSIALSSTFLAHCIGSIIWLYTIQMTSEQWLALIPLVAVERIVFASGISLSIFSLKYAFRLLEFVFRNKKRELRDFEKC